MYATIKESNVIKNIWDSSQAPYPIQLMHNYQPKTEEKNSKKKKKISYSQAI